MSEAEVCRFLHIVQRYDVMSVQCGYRFHVPVLQSPHRTLHMKLLCHYMQKSTHSDITFTEVKTNDNSFYLDHSFDKSKNGSGWIFMDYRNTGFFTDKNSILYAHGGSSKAFFNQLNRILDNNHFDKKDNRIIYIYDDQFIYGFEIFSAYHIKTTSDYIKTNFSNDNEFLSFINLIKNR